MLPYGKILQKKSSCNLEQAERSSKKRKKKNMIFETASSEINGFL